MAAWTPLDLAGLVAWYDASDLSTITDAGAGAVSQWADKSGNGNHVTQGTAGLRPTTGIRTQNGLNVIDFDGGDWLVSADIADVAQPVTLAAVAMPDNLDDAAHNVWGNAPGLGNQPSFNVNGGVWRMYAGTPVVSAVPDTAVPRLVVAVFNGASSLLRINGSQVVSGDAGANPLRILSLGSNEGTSQFWDGWIAEAIAVEGAVAGSDLTNLESYLNAEWAVY